MPKTSTAIDPVLEHQEEELNAIRERIAHVRQLQRDYAGPIIAAGVLSDNELWTDLLAILTRDVERKYREPLIALFDRLLDEGHDLRVPDPCEDDPANTSEASDTVFSYAMGYGDQGFLLGLAVGMQLGPHALDALEPATRKAGVR